MKCIIKNGLVWHRVVFECIWLQYWPFDVFIILLTQTKSINTDIKSSNFRNWHTQLHLMNHINHLLLNLFLLVFISLFVSRMFAKLINWFCALWRGKTVRLLAKEQLIKQWWGSRSTVSSAKTCYKQFTNYELDRDATLASSVFLQGH